MIFCFSGTGNSFHVAQIIAQANQEQIIMITETEREQRKKYILKDREKVGFVFPIYWWGMPMLVEQFIKDLALINYCENYTYAIATYGLGARNGMVDLEKLLHKKNILLHAKYEVKMVDNYIVGYELASKETQSHILAKAEEKIFHIMESIEREEEMEVKDLLGYIVKPIVHHLYKITNHRNKFYVTDTCVGCGICQAECPCNTIKLKDKKPTWEKNCSFCLKCLHHCPKQSIQYGKRTAQRTRYYYSD